MNNTRKQMICLDIIRIFACFSVLAVHIAIVFNIPGRIGRLMEAGSNGLGIFYILSGMLIFMSLDSRKDSIRAWYIKRLLRILPMYYFVLILYIVIYELALKSAPTYALGPNLCGWAAYFLGFNTILAKQDTFWYNIGAVSSMSVFIWFYILAPVIKKLVTNWRRALCFIAVSYLLLRVLQHTQWLQMFAAYYYFAIGIWVYYAISEHKEKETSVISLCILVLLILADGKGGMLYALVIGLLILNTYDINIGNAKVCAVVKFLSARTFAIYLAHATVMQLMDLLNIQKNAVGMIKCVVYSVIGIAILHELVEKGAVKLYGAISSRSGKANE